MHEEHGDHNVDTNIKVAVRCRPLNSKEKNNAEQLCAKVYPEQIVLTNPENKNEEHSFAFDLVFPEDVTQEEVWVKVGLPILDKAISGYNSTIFAYGQTGSGKTWSMQGGDGDLQGIIPRMNMSLFERIETERQTRPTIQFLVTVSYFEIYNEVIFDLLDASDRKKRNSKGGLEIKEHPALGVYVKGLQEIVVDHAAKLLNIVDQGMRNRTVASTQMNADSSRSHSVFMITIHQKDEEDPSKNIFAKINLVDLAGSERVKSTGATGATLKEGANINKSLSALGNVINALVEAGKGRAVFIPYRNSKLTRVLQESLGGNSITSMLAAMSPAACNFEETLSTLKYANRAKAIKVKAIKNEEASAVSRLNDEIRTLKEKLAQSVLSGGEGTGNGVLSEKNKQQLKELEEAVRNTWEAKTKMSREHEEERQRLLQEQQLAAQQLQSAKDRSWVLLEQKGLVELTLSHVREQTKGAGDLSQHLDKWADALAQSAFVEKALTEQQAIIQVFRSSLEKDSSSIAKMLCATVEGKSIDGVYLVSSLSALRDKTHSMIEELSQWSVQQQKLDLSLNSIVESVNSFSLSFKVFLLAAVQREQEQYAVGVQPDDVLWSADSEGPENAFSITEREDALRGLELISKQLRSKRTQQREQWSNNQVQLSDMNNVLQQLQQLHGACSQVSRPGASAELSRSWQRFVTSLAALKLDSNISQKPAATSISVEDAEFVSYSVEDANSFALCKSMHSEAPPRVGLTDGRSLNRLDTTDQENDTMSSCFHCIVNTHGVNDVNGDLRCSQLALLLDSPSLIRRVRLAGARFMRTKVIHDDPEHAVSTNAIQTSSMSSLSSSQLPCGVTLAQCTGDIATTTAALADVLDWSTLLKKNSPEKFLQRPPVRFLFDLFSYLASLYPGALPPNIQSADWDSVGASRESKIDYMNEVIDFVSEQLSVEPTTTGSAIVAGNDASKTNILLQHTALCMIAHCVQLGLPLKGQNTMNLISSSTINSSIADRSNAQAVRDNQRERLRDRRVLCSSWITDLKMQYFGENGELLLEQTLQTGLKDIDGVCEIDASALSGKCARLVISPQRWVNNEIPAVFGLRLEILSASHANSALTPVWGDDQLLSGAKLVEQALVDAVLAVDDLNKAEQADKVRRQEEMKKHMEAMAAEKAQLAQSLATEKDALLTSNQSLSDQLQECFKQLQERTELLEKEQELNLQLEKSRIQAEEEQSNLLQSMGERERENAQLQTALLRMEALLEKEKANMADMIRQLTEKTEEIDGLQADLQYAIKSRDVLEGERDELQHSLVVLTEERDTARAHEEELFEKLTEVSNDLDILQISYVDITERCNDAQDEVSELRDQISNLQETLSLQRAAVSAVSSAPAAVSQASASPKHSAQDNSLQKKSSKPSARTSLEHNRLSDGDSSKDKARFISVDDSKATSKSRGLDEDYQEDFDDE